jgi:chromosome segregation ATPase
MQEKGLPKTPLMAENETLKEKNAQLEQELILVKGRISELHDNSRDARLNLKAINSENDDLVRQNEQLKQKLAELKLELKQITEESHSHAYTFDKYKDLIRKQSDRVIQLEEELGMARLELERSVTEIERYKASQQVILEMQEKRMKELTIDKEKVILSQC